MRNTDGWLQRLIWRILLGFAGTSIAGGIYRGVFGREASANELAEFTSLVRNRDDFSTRVESLLKSREFRQRSFEATKDELAGALTLGILGRELGPDERAACVASLQRPEDVAPAVSSLVTSPEFRRTSFAIAAPEFAEAVYKGIIGSAPNPPDLAAAAASLRCPEDLRPLAERLLNSAEFRQKNLAASAPRWVRAAFEGLLERAPDPHGLKAHTARLVEKNDIANLLRVIVQSSEFASKIEARLRNANATASSARGPVAARAGGGRLIILSSNCQTAGLAAALQECLPGDTVVPSPLPEGRGPEAEKHFVANLANADIWISGWDRTWARDRGFEERPEFRYVRIPTILFPAFHPDFCHAKIISENKLTASGFNSGIGVWAYNRGLEIADARKLFNRESYARLGYFDLWNPCLTALRSSFATCELDFERFMLGVKRRGAFMHTINHPKVEVLVDLAKLVAMKIGASSSIFEREINISDGLTREIWPLYPEIADEFSLPHGSYDWKVANNVLAGVEAYLENVFGNYHSQRIPRGGLELVNRDRNSYDRALGSQLRNGA